MRARLPGQGSIRDIIIEMVYLNENDEIVNHKNMYMTWRAFVLLFTHLGR
jgi:hypothetical protein